MIPRWACMLVILLKIASCEIRNCCEGKNIIEAKKCKEGSIENVLNCQAKFLLKSDNDESVRELEDGLEVDESTTIRSDEFCKTTINSSIVYIVCHSSVDSGDPGKIFVIMGLLSSVCLLFTIAIYVSLPKLLDLQGICMVHSFLGLAIIFIILGLNQFLSEIATIVCTPLAYLLYFSFLYAFFWLNTYCFNIWRTTIQPSALANVTSWKKIYYIYSCGCPTVLLLLVLFSHYSNIYIYVHPRMADKSCWFGSLEATFVYLYIPISILLILNIIFFFWTIYGLWREIHQYDGKKSKILRYRLSLCIKMFFVMGLSWIFEVLSAVFVKNHPSNIWKITDAINALQGVLLFLIFVVFRKKVYRLVAEKPYGKCLPRTWMSISGEEDEEEEIIDNVQDYSLDRVNIPQ